MRRTSVDSSLRIEKKNISYSFRRNPTIDSQLMKQFGRRSDERIPSGTQKLTTAAWDLYQAPTTTECVIDRTSIGECDCSCAPSLRRDPVQSLGRSSPRSTLNNEQFAHLDFGLPRGVASTPSFRATDCNAGAICNELCMNNPSTISGDLQKRCRSIQTKCNRLISGTDDFYKHQSCEVSELKLSVLQRYSSRCCKHNIHSRLNKNNTKTCTISNAACDSKSYSSKFMCRSIHQRTGLNAKYRVLLPRVRNFWCSYKLQLQEHHGEKEINTKNNDSTAQTEAFTEDWNCEMFCDLNCNSPIGAFAHDSYYCRELPGGVDKDNPACSKNERIVTLASSNAKIMQGMAAEESLVAPVYENL